MLVADLMRCSSFRRLGTVHLLSGWPVFSPGMQTHTGQCVCSPVARRAASGSGGGAFLVEGVPLAVLAFARLVLVARYSLKWTRTSSKVPSSMRPFGAGSCDDFRMGSCVSCATSGANSLPLPESSTLVSSLSMGMLAASPSFQSWRSWVCASCSASAHSSNDAACRLRVMSVRRLRRSTCVTPVRAASMQLRRSVMQSSPHFACANDGCCSTCRRQPPFVSMSHSIFANSCFSSLAKLSIFSRYCSTASVYLREVAPLG